MQAVGGTMVRHLRDLNYMGFVEVARHWKTILGNIAFCKKDIADFQPDVMVFIDYPGFNLKIAKYTHRLGIRNVHYISPQLWAWKKGRLKSMRKSLDRLCYILPFEQEFYARNEFPGACYVGHPLLDAVMDERHEDKGMIALLPGSRKQEIQRLLPTMLDLAARYPQYQFRVAGMSLLGEDLYREIGGNRWGKNVDIVYDNTYSLLSQATAAVVCSGTATLEAALFRVPQVVVYKSSALSVAIARRLVGKRIRYISLPNLIADKQVVRELIQEDYNLRQLSMDFSDLLEHSNRRQTMLADYEALIAKMGGAGASDRVADIIINL